MAGKADQGGVATPGNPSGGRTVDGQAWVMQLIRRHVRIGWFGLLVFLTLGIVLELLHSFKVPVYLSPANSTRRLLWTLAHSHGTLFSLIHVAFASTLAVWGWTSRHEGATGPPWRTANLSGASRCLTGALVLMPVGFFAGGWGLQAGDPGWGIFLAPVGAALLLIGVTLTLLALRTEKTSAPSAPSALKKPPRPLR